MFFGISEKIRRKTRKNFSDLLKSHCGMSEYSIEDLMDAIDREEAIYYGLAKFEKTEKRRQGILYLRFARRRVSF